MRNSAYERWVKERSFERFKKRLLEMDKYDHESKGFLAYLDILPQKDSEASFEISANKGKLEAINVKNLPEFAVDVLKLNKNSRTESTVINRSAIFKPTKGECILRYVKKDKHYEESLSPAQIHEMEANIQFTLQTNGMGCDIVLLLGRS